MALGGGGGDGDQGRWHCQGEARQGRTSSPGHWKMQERGFITAVGMETGSGLASGHGSREDRLSQPQNGHRELGEHEASRRHDASSLKAPRKYQAKDHTPTSLLQP